MSDEETPPVEETPEEIQPEPTTPEATGEVPESTTPETPEQFDWSQFQNADRFKGHTVQEVIDHYNGREHQYGSQTKELGDLRSYREQNEARQRQATGQPAPVKKPTFTEGQQFEFAKKFQDAPLGAVSEFMVPQLAEQLTPMVWKNVQQQLGPAMQNYAQNVATDTEYAALVRNHPEIETDQELRWSTHTLMGPEYLGSGVPYEQAMFLAKLGKDERSLFSTTCYLMRQGVTFDRAKRFAENEQNAPESAETKKQQLKEEVTGIRRGAKASTKGARTSEPEIETMDDAFAVD